MIMAPRNESPLSQKANPYSFDFSRPILSLKILFVVNPNKLYSQIYSLYMSYPRELIEHGIMLVSCNKDILRLSVGGSIELLIHSFLIHSICSSDSHLSHSTLCIKKVGNSKIKCNGDFKVNKNQSYRVYFPLSSCIYRKKKKREKKRKRKRKEERSGKQSETKGSPHKRTESPWIASKPALFSVLY